MSHVVVENIKPVILGKWKFLYDRAPISFSSSRREYIIYIFMMGIFNFTFRGAGSEYIYFKSIFVGIFEVGIIFDFPLSALLDEFKMVFNGIIKIVLDTLLSIAVSLSYTEVLKKKYLNIKERRIETVSFSTWPNSPSIWFENSFTFNQKEKVISRLYVTKLNFFNIGDFFFDVEFLYTLMLLCTWRNFFNTNVTAFGERWIKKARLFEMFAYKMRFFLSVGV